MAQRSHRLNDRSTGRSVLLCWKSRDPQHHSVTFPHCRTSCPVEYRLRKRPACECRCLGGIASTTTPSLHIWSASPGNESRHVHRTSGGRRPGFILVSVAVLCRGKRVSPCGRVAVAVVASCSPNYQFNKDCSHHHGPCTHGSA